MLLCADSHFFRRLQELTSRNQGRELAGNELFERVPSIEFSEQSNPKVTCSNPCENSLQTCAAFIVRREKRLVVEISSFEDHRKNAFCMNVLKILLVF